MKKVKIETQDKGTYEIDIIEKEQALEIVKNVCEKDKTLKNNVKEQVNYIKIESNFIFIERLLYLFYYIFIYVPIFLPLKIIKKAEKDILT